MISWRQVEDSQLFWSIFTIDLSSNSLNKEILKLYVISLSWVDNKITVIAR